MKFLKYTTLLLSLLVSATAMTSCNDDDAPAMGQVDMEFENVVGSSALELNKTTPYTTTAGDQFTVDKFRYFISNIKLKKADGTEFVQPESYYLIDQAIAASQKFSIPNVPAGDYTSLTFTIGVDSTRNVSGAQTGALTKDDMFWSWNTGYIFMKLEGKSPQAPGTGGPVILHIGGFRKGQNAVQTVTPSLNSNLIQVRGSRTPEVHIKADVLKIFAGSTPIRFAQVNNIMMPGANAVNVSRNYAAGMFTVDHIHGN